MIKTLACSNQDTASSNGRQRSSFATSFVSFATGHVRDSAIPAAVAVIAGAGPRSDTLTEAANTDSVPGAGRRRLSRPFERALIFGANFKTVSSAVTRVRMVAASLAITATFRSTTARVRH